MNLSNVLYANHQNDIAASAVPSARPHKYEMDVGAQFDRKTNLAWIERTRWKIRLVTPLLHPLSQGFN